MRSRSRTMTRLVAAAAIVLLAAPLVATVAHGADAQRLPDEFQAVASAAGLSIVSYKDPNPLPVGPGAFLTFETPEADGELTALRKSEPRSGQRRPLVLGDVVGVATVGLRLFDRAA